MADSHCPFCLIISRRQSDAREVYRSNEIVAFLPLEPATLGHTLVVPRLHVEDIWHLDDEMTVALARATVQIAQAVRQAVKPDGLNVIQSNGSVATQTVPHVHVHIVPRWSNDQMGQIWPTTSEFADGEKDQVWHSICEQIEAHS